MYKETAGKLEEERKKNRLPAIEKETLIFISLRLFLFRHIGFRAVSRVLEILKQYLGITKVPCTQTIINRVAGYSLSKIWNYSGVQSVCLDGTKFANGAVWIIDTSIALGAGKILAVLELKANYFEKNTVSPALEDINCAAIVVAK